MNIVEISGSLGNGLKRYNVFEKVSMSRQPFTQRSSILYGITKPTDIVQINEPTNILVDAEGNPIRNSKPVYFGIRVYPFISMSQQISVENNNISYGRAYGLSSEYWFPNMNDFVGSALLPNPYTGTLYPQPEFVETLGSSQSSTINYRQAMQQFINDCVFPTKPKLNLTGQSQSSQQGSNGIPYFDPNVYILTGNDEPKGVLSIIQDKVENFGYKKYMVQFNGKNLNFKFGVADNSDFTEVPKIYLPFLYRTYVALVNENPQKGVCMGVVMQCLLYDNLGNVITG